MKIEFTETKERFPEAKDFDSECAPYYLVVVEKYGIQRAMFLMKDGEKGWYSNYYSKIIAPVLAWGI